MFLVGALDIITIPGKWICNSEEVLTGEISSVYRTVSEFISNSKNATTDSGFKLLLVHGRYGVQRRLLQWLKPLSKLVLVRVTIAKFS